MKPYAFLFLLLQLQNYSAFCQDIPVLYGTVNEQDKIDPVEDKDYGVGDDGIYNIVEPFVRASSELLENGRSFAAKNAGDYNLGIPWIEGKPGYGIGEYLEFCFDLRDRPNKGNAFSINSVSIINGYRKNEKIWKANSRVKTFKMYVNGKPFSYIVLKDTYKYQHFTFPDHWVRHGALTVIKLEIIEVYRGEKHADTAVGEILFNGLYSENMGLSEHGN